MDTSILYIYIYILLYIYFNICPHKIRDDMIFELVTMSL
jgi:hypothetical protein